MRAALIAAFLPLAILTACGAGDSPEQEAALTPIETLEDLSTRACLCRMAGHDDGVLRNEYERLTANLEGEGLGSASLPLSSSVTCFPELGERACVTHSLDVVATNGADFACTNEQAGELEAIWNRAVVEERAEQADADLMKRLEAMREELRQSLTQADCGADQVRP